MTLLLAPSLLFARSSHIFTHDGSMLKYGYIRLRFPISPFPHVPEMTTKRNTD